MKTQLILWDWNGTLLDDVLFCVDALNGLLARFGYPQRYTLEQYRQIFGFPVQDYYVRAGFDFNRHPFDVLAEDYMAHYIPESVVCGPIDGAQETLQALKQAGLHQVVLSASYRTTLQAQVSRLGLGRYFDELLGLGDIYAKSKVQLGLNYLKEHAIDPAQVVMVGDTVHDHEVANALGVRCVLYTGGHQPFEKLQATGCPVVQQLQQLLSHLP